MENILQHASMANCRPASIPVDSTGKLLSNGTVIDDAASYRSLAGALQYHTITHPDLAFAVQQTCLHKHDPRAPHMVMLKRILHYVRRTMSLGLHLCMFANLAITAYSDADWADCLDTRR
jgi:hypothetical protein